MTLTHEQLQAAGAVLAGVTSGGTAYLGIRLLIKRGEDDCKRRFEAFREGMKVQREKDPQ